MKTPPSNLLRPGLPRLLVALLLAAFAVPAAAAAQSSGEEPEPPAMEPSPPPENPVIEIQVPSGPQTITLIVPPLTEEKRSAPEPAPKPDSGRRPQPARRYTAPVAAAPPSTHEPEPVYSPTPLDQTEPSAVQSPQREAVAKSKAKAKAKAARKPQPARRTTTVPKPLPAAAVEPALPVLTIVEERRSLAAALPQPPYAPEDTGAALPYLLFVLGLAGAGLLALAGAAPRLALLWPGIFVRVIRERDVLSLFGLCLLASGVLAWAIAGAGI